MGAIAFFDALAIGGTIEMTSQRGERVMATGVQGGGAIPGAGPIALFVDPQNSTGFAANTNTGQTGNNVPPGSGPILTTAENDTRFIGRKLTGNTTITYLSEDLQNVGVLIDQLDLGGFTLTFNMPTIVVHTGGTITEVTAIDPTVASGGQRERLQVSDFTDWAPFIYNAHGLPGTATAPTRVIDLTRDCAAWVASEETGEATFGHFSRPVNNAVTSSPQFVVADSYQIVRPGRLPLATQPAVSSPQGGQVVFNNAQIVSEGLGLAAPTAFSITGITFNHCSFTGPLLFGGAFNDCYCGDGAQGIFIATMIAGVYLPNNNTDQLQGVLNMGGDVYITGDSSLLVGASFLSTLFIFSAALGVVGFTGIQLQSIGVTSVHVPALQMAGGASVDQAGAIWGNGSSGLGLQVFAGATWQVNSPLVSANLPNLTGGDGDFGFLVNNVQITQARFYDATSGAPSALITCSWANFIAAQPAGFGGHALCTQANAGVST